MVQCNKKSFSLTRAYLFIFFVFLFIYQTDSVNAQIMIKKYINAEVLVFNKLTKERVIFKIPTKSSILYKNMKIKVNSCFKIMDEDQDFVTNLTLEYINEEVVEKSENIILYFIKRSLNIEPEDPYYEFKLLRCDDEKDIIVNNIYNS